LRAVLSVLTIIEHVFTSIFKKFNWRGIIQTIVGAFIISAGWNWYHIKHRPYSRFIFLVLLTGAAVFVGYRIFKWLYHFFTIRFNRHVFWQKEFARFLDSLFLTFSLFFLVFFSTDQLLSIVIFLVLMGIFYYKSQGYIARHPNAAEWKIVNKNIFTIIFFLFSLFSVFQYLAYKLVNFDAYIKFNNIVFFRAWAMTMFWVLGFVVATLIYWKMKSLARYLVLGIWALLFLFLLILWSINIGIMYFSGLYFNPLMLEVTRGSSGVVFNWITATITAGGLAIIVLFGLLFRRLMRSYQASAFRPWAYYSLVLIPVALFSIIGLSSFKNTPEYTIARNFYQFFLGKETEVALSPIIQAKLEKFGLSYDTSQFTLAHKNAIFTPGTVLLPAFKKNKPNVIIVFFESFSARLTSVYDQTFPGLTPGLEQMASDTSTILFKNYYNASTPTINGIIAQLCSFLPPTGYTEIEVDKNLQRLRLLCLPDILKQNGGYKSATYITAVNKEFENKNAIFSSMDTDGIYGQQELQNIIQGEPLSWGYSDHQLFPAMWNLVNKEKQEPFLMMLSTVDTHPPFDIAKDMVLYQDGKNTVLNSYHTSDDAFGKFWQEFKQSKYYDNTIVVAVADHAAFPGAEIKKLFPEDSKSLSFYDPNMLMMYVPHHSLPKEVTVFSSSIDVIPTLLQILNINIPNSFEGHSVFDDRDAYPNLLGMHEYGLYINQEANGKRNISYQIPSDLICAQEDFSNTTNTPLTLCEYLDFYKWKRQMFEQGRFWGK
jgi:phosphoglycerol transferase MdoB-like AlkP superfamily enzyme